MVSPILEKARKIRLVLTDVDGVLTDGGVYYSAEGEELKRFNLKDGMGVERLRRLADIETGILTGELMMATRRRAEKLGITELHLGCSHKVDTMMAIAAARKLGLEAIAYIGDDLNDLECMQRAGLAACPQDAFDDIKSVADWICERRGGEGAFRELAEIILTAQLGNRT